MIYYYVRVRVRVLTVRDVRKIKRRREVMGLSFVCIIVIIIIIFLSVGGFVGL